MKKGLGIGALGAALLLSGMLVGVSYAGGGIVEPQTIELINGPGEESRDYPLLDAEGKVRGSMSVYREPVLDVDGNDVGTVHVECILAKGINYRCTSIAVLKPGPHTQAGSILFAGVFRGFNGESLAVTGGTGAYENVRGSVTLSVEGDDFVRTLHLIP
jgi:hypothetical protein